MRQILGTAAVVATLIGGIGAGVTTMAVAADAETPASQTVVIADRIIPPGTICGMCYVP
ncbi:hypothetical protein ABZZ36_26790 [Actinacidiphila glaucinigra]|uniref:hypothetical protein n=1 Tax=Actinacidiphila glaucinigra TaxID=235986 RepID=UPI0033B88BBA